MCIRDRLKTDHRIELAEGLSADCRQLLSQLQDADKARQDAADRQTAYVAAQAALDKAEEEYSTLQRQLNANRAGLLARDLEKGKPCPVCGSTRHQMCIRDRPVAGCTDTKVHHILHQNIAGVFSAGQASFTQSKACLHKEHQKRRNKCPCYIC